MVSVGSPAHTMSSNRPRRVPLTSQAPDLEIRSFRSRGGDDASSIAQHASGTIERRTSATRRWTTPTETATRGAEPRDFGRRRFAATTTAAGLRAESAPRSRRATSQASPGAGAPVSCTFGRRHPAATPALRGHGSRGRSKASLGSTDARRCALRASWREGPMSIPAGREVWAGPSRGAARQDRHRQGRVVPRLGVGTPPPVRPVVDAQKSTGNPGEHRARFAGNGVARPRTPGRSNASRSSEPRFVTARRHEGAVTRWKLSWRGTLWRVERRRGVSRPLRINGGRFMKRGEPQGRQRDATSPQRSRRRKPSRW
jgi:hypothetical protein